MNWIHYLAEANLYMVAFYVLYVLLLRSETHYQLNRAYLLITSVLAFIIPLIQLGILKPVIQTTANITIGDAADFSPIIVQSPIVAEAPKWTTDDYILLIYGIVAFVLLIHLCIRIYLLIALSKKGSVQKNNGFKVIELHQGSVAFSFFNNLFIDDRFASSQTVLYHEQVHIRQKHSWDIIYLELLKIINWFNPVIYLIIAAIKELHEFIADEQTVSLENNNDAYTDFLISNAYGITQNPLTNSFFNKNLLKRRITMLYQQKSGKAARLKYLLALPLICGLLCLSTMAFTTKTYGWIDLAPQMAAHNAKQTQTTHHRIANTILQTPTTVTQPEQQNNIIPDDAKSSSGQDKLAPATGNTVPALNSDTIKKSNNAVYTAVEENPRFPGDESAFGEFLKQNIHYPANDKKNGVEGKVYLQFIIEKDGSLTDIKIVRSPSDAMSEEAVRVLKLSPKWNPGKQNGQPVRVQFTVPISFSLGNTTLVPPPNVNLQLPPPADADPKNSDVFTAVEISPDFPGGTAAFGKFLQKNIRYPKEDWEKKIQGKVYIQFIIENNGSLSNLKVLRTPSTAMGNEAVRVLSLSPNWKPGVQNGRPVRVQYTVPINFSLSDDGPRDINALYKFMQRNIKYPYDSRVNQITGRVLVEFTLDANMQMQNIKVLRSPDNALGDEVVRVLQNFKGLSNGDPSAIYTIPVFFGLNSDKSGDVAPKSTGIDNKAQAGNRVFLNEVVVMGY